MPKTRMKKVGLGRLISTSTNLLLPTLNPLTGGRLTVTVIPLVPSLKPLFSAAVLATVATFGYMVARGIAKSGSRSRAHDPREDIDLGGH